MLTMAICSRALCLLTLVAIAGLGGAFGKNGTDTALISDMKAYHDNLPEVDIFEGQTIIVKEVLCGRPAFCFYCPLAATLAKPFWILDGVVQDEAYVNKIGLKCLKALYAGYFSDLFDAYDYLSLAVLDPASEDAELEEIVKKAHHKLKLLEYLACKPKEPPHYPPLYSPDSPVCNACANVDSLECKYHIKQLCNEGYVHVKHGYGQKPVPDFEANFLWISLGHKTPKVCDTLLEGYSDHAEANESHVLLVHVIVHHCEEQRSYNPCPKPAHTYGKMPGHKGSSYGAQPTPYGHGGSAPYQSKPDYGYDSSYHDPHMTPAHYNSGQGYGGSGYGNPYEEPEPRYHDPPAGYSTKPAYGTQPHGYTTPYSEQYSPPSHYEMHDYSPDNAGKYPGGSVPMYNTGDSSYGTPYDHQKPKPEYSHEENGPAPSY